MSRQIKVVRLGYVTPGMHIASVDSDDWAPGELVPSDQYLADEQDWQHVVRVRGHADIGTVTCAGYNGDLEEVRVSWDGACWLLVDDKGEPVVQEVEL